MKTVIEYYSNGDYHVRDDDKHSQSHRFAGQKYRVVFAVNGDFIKDIKRFGARKFMRLMNAYDPHFDAAEQIFGE